MSKQVNYEQQALLYAEKYGIIDYQVHGNTMIYYEMVNDGADEYSVYKAEVNLDTMKEKRKTLKQI